MAIDNSLWDSPKKSRVRSKYRSVLFKHASSMLNLNDRSVCKQPAKRRCLSKQASWQSRPTNTSTKTHTHTHSETLSSRGSTRDFCWTRKTPALHLRTQITPSIPLHERHAAVCIRCTDTRGSPRLFRQFVLKLVTDRATWGFQWCINCHQSCSNMMQMAAKSAAVATRTLP